MNLSNDIIVIDNKFKEHMNMAIYRIKQFIWAVTAKFKPIDYKIVNKYLTKREQAVFNKLGASEKQHSIRVCKEALDKYDNYDIDIDKNKLAKIALLHDIGKSKKKLNTIDKSVIVLLDKFTKGKLKKYDINKKIDVYYNHPQKAVDILKKLDKYDNEFLEAIEKHHYKHIKSNIYLKIIKECDDNN